MTAKTGNLLRSPQKIAYFIEWSANQRQHRNCSGEGALACSTLSKEQLVCIILKQYRAISVLFLCLLVINSKNDEYKRIKRLSVQTQRRGKSNGIP